MIIIGLLDSTLEEGLDVKAEGTDGGNRNRELHTDGATCMLSRGGYTLLWLAVSSSSPFLLFSTLGEHLSQHPAITKIKKKLCFLNWKLFLKRERRHCSDGRGLGKGANLVMEAIEERMRKLGEEDEIEEKNQEARNEEMKAEMSKTVGFAELPPGLPVTKTE